ncbi:MAG: thioredoxin fold domain-containing protein [Planctomycetota bacterium]|jgi:thioredoxin-related protein
MKREVFADDEVAEVIEQGFIPLSIDSSDPGAVGLMRRYGVGATPTTVLVDAQGNMLRGERGKLGKADFLTLLSSS